MLGQGDVTIRVVTVDEGIEFVASYATTARVALQMAEHRRNETESLATGTFEHEKKSLVLAGRFMLLKANKCEKSLIAVFAPKILLLSVGEKNGDRSREVFFYQYSGGFMAVTLGGRMDLEITLAVERIFASDAIEASVRGGIANVFC